MDFEIINSLLVIFVFIVSQMSVMGVKKVKSSENEFYKKFLTLAIKIDEHDKELPELSKEVKRLSSRVSKIDRELTEIKEKTSPKK